MVFSSITFIFLFLPVFLVAYYITPKKWRNFTALFFSYLFYAWGAPKFVFILFVASLFDYIISKKIVNQTIQKKKKQLLWLSIVVNILLLGYFKYANFFVDQFDTIVQWFGGVGGFSTSVLLPIGISFFTFQKISYVVDVYRGTTKPAKNFITFALYVALFPQLIAGPIVRYFDIAKQLEKRKYSVEKFFQGMWRFSIGLSKKVLVANYVGQIADLVFNLGDGQLTTGYAWIGILAYSMQIYFDFSGYSDMAIGLGRMMGFDFLENFNKPYIAKSFTDFWRRWHISLSNWMKEYLYIPLGGNRVSKYRMYFNLWVVFLISGLWHGAAWTFIFWGAYHGFFLMLDKMFWLKIVKKLPTIITIPFTFFLILIGWVFFRAESFFEAFKYIAVMFGKTFEAQQEFFYLRNIIITNREIVMLILALFICFIPITPVWRKIKKWWLNKSWQASKRLIEVGITFVLLLLSVVTLANAGFNPFIYFQF